MRNTFIVRLEAIINHYKASNNAIAYISELKGLDSDIRRLFNRGDNVDDLNGITSFLERKLSL